MALIKQSTAYTRMFMMIQSSDHVTGLTGATVTVTLSKAGGAFGAAGGTVTEVSDGWYKIALTTTDTNTLGDLAFHCTAASGDPTDFVDQVSARITDDLCFPTTSGRSLDVTATGAAGIDWGNVENPTTTVGLTGTTIATTQQVDVNTIKTNPVVNGGTVTFPTNATLASTTNITAGTVTTVSGNVNGSVGSVTGAVGSVTGNVGGNVTGSVGSVTGNVGGTINGLTATALADFFDTDSGTTFGSAVAGSVVKEIADNAGGSSLTETGIAETVCEYMHTFDTTYDYSAVVTGSAIKNLLTSAIKVDLDPYTLADAGSLVWCENRGILLSELGSDAISYQSAAFYILDGICSRTVDATDVSDSTAAALILRGMINKDTGLTFASSVPGSPVYEIATNSGGSNPWTTVIDGTYTAQECIRLIGAAVAGECDVTGNSIVFRNLNDSKNRISATTNAEGDRSAITYDAS